MRLETAKRIADAGRGMKVITLPRSSGNSGPHALEYRSPQELLYAVAVAARSIDDPLEMDWFLEDCRAFKFTRRTVE